MRLLAAPLLAVACGLALPVQSAEVVTTVRVFRLRDSRVTIRQATEAVQPLLSDNGTLTVQPHQRQLIVQDRPEVVARVATVLEELNRAPEHYRIRVELLEASDQPLSAEERVTVAAQVSRMFRYRSFRRLGATLFEGEVGQSATGQLGEAYKIGFVTADLPASEDQPFGIAQTATEQVHLNRLTLLHTQVDASGAEKQTLVLRTSVVLGPGQSTILGASASEGSSRALVLVLQAQPAEDH